MSSGSHHVVRCRECNKPFDKEFTLKRHLYYCRSRRSIAIPRIRSCMTCAKNKQKCDSKIPECSRCAAKHALCVYPEAKNPLSRSTNATSSESSTLTTSLPFGFSAASTTSDGLLNSDQMRNFEPGVVDFGFDNFTTDCRQPLDSEFDLMISPATTHDKMAFPQLESLWEVYSMTPVTPQQALFRTSIPVAPTSRISSITKRPTRRANAARNTGLILSVLRSYPLIIHQSNFLPPFIHPAILSNPQDPESSEGLTTCINLIQKLYQLDDPSIRKLFWRNVKFECERMCAEHTSMSAWTLLTSMQALSIYLIARLAESPDSASDLGANLDAQLVQTATMLSKALSASTILSACSSPSRIFADTTIHHMSSWYDFLFTESIRRLCIIYQIVNLVFYFAPAKLCDLPVQLVLAPLPARKTLWEADSAEKWVQERSSENGAADLVYGMTNTGALVKVETGLCHESAAVVGSDDTLSHGDSLGWRQADWEEWCARMDGLGGLIMLATNLVS